MSPSKGGTGNHSRLPVCIHCGKVRTGVDYFKCSRCGKKNPY